MQQAPDEAREGAQGDPGRVRRIDLNADLGEGITDDEGLLAVVSSANVACGFHAGDASVMRAVCEAAAARGVVVGAQVSYRDREGFGRRPMEVAADVLTGWVAEQVGALTDAARRAGVEVSYVKPHGALYNRAVDDAQQAAAVLAGSGALPVLGLPGSVLLRLAERDGRVAVPEGFPDRGYTPDGRLVPRTEPGALVHGADQVSARAVALAEGGTVQTVCVHGDSADAVATAHAVRRALLAAGYAVRSWWLTP
jgi:5-oxoprolinase (ATP-hydrolysing) subunit A